MKFAYPALALLAFLLTASLGDVALCQVAESQAAAEPDQPKP